MIIDVFCFVLLALAIFKGYSKGLVVALFSVLAFVVGIAAAIKLSAVVAVRFGQNAGVSGQWLPVASFMLVFIAVVVLVRLGAKLLEKTLALALLGWANRLGGIVLYVVTYMLLLSVVVFYAAQVKLVSPQMLTTSRTWPWIEPWGPKAMDLLGKLLPFFKNMFAQLQVFFEGVAQKQL